MKTGDGRIRSTVCHVSLQAGPNVCLAYRMAYFRVCQNCNGTLPDRRIVMVYFRSSRIVMAPVKKPLKFEAANHDDQRGKRCFFLGLVGRKSDVAAGQTALGSLLACCARSTVEQTRPSLPGLPSGVGWECIHTTRPCKFRPMIFNSKEPRISSAE